VQAQPQPQRPDLRAAQAGLAFDLAEVRRQGT
jgi:hypothetical protein